MLTSPVVVAHKPPLITLDTDLETLTGRGKINPIIEVGNPNHYRPSKPQGDFTSLLDSHKDDLQSFTAYSQGMHEATEVEGAEDNNKEKGLQTDTLLDTGALGVDGNYISHKMAKTIDKFRKYMIARDELRICSGLSEVCTIRAIVSWSLLN